MRKAILFISIALIFSCSEKGSLDEKNRADAVENQEAAYDNLIDNTSESVSQSNLSFLALGDSYTIGESVLEDERWPNQMVDIAFNQNVLFNQPDIIAKTGWRTEQLIDTLNRMNFTQ